jgi:hypothetical protein
MKKTLVAVCALLVTAGVYAQGTVNFNNRVPSAGINAPVVITGGPNATGPDWVAQLYAGAANAAESALVAVGTPVAFSTVLPGFFAGGTVTIPASVMGGTGGGNAAVQVRAWNVNAGATFEAASASGSGFGKSGVLASIATGNPNNAPPDLPKNLVGLTGFSVSPVAVPEPTVLALGAIGGLALLIRRRK